MALPKIKRALISVYDKTGIVDFARALHEEFGIEIISTGGTARTLREAGIPVTLIEHITGFPELLDGRVKTLHPAIHAGILADRDNPEHMRQLAAHGIQPIDMVVVNLYPFEKTVADPNCTFEQAVEMIDIGGVALLRAAGKNSGQIHIAADPDDYESSLLLLRGESDRVTDFLDTRGFQVFVDTAMYDGMVATWLSKPMFNAPESVFPTRFLRLIDWGPIRYGENPHQRAELVGDPQIPGGPDLTTADSLIDVDDQQQKMSFTNYLDADAALQLCRELTIELCGNGLKPREHNHSVCVFIKHTNACGVGIADDPIEAYRRAYLSDPNAAMGGTLAVNFSVDTEFAEGVLDSLPRWGKNAKANAFFLDVWISTGFEEEAVKVIRAKKSWGQNVRLLNLFIRPQDIKEEFEFSPNEYELRSIGGGMLVQSRDSAVLNEDQWRVVTQRAPSESEISDLKLAWLIAKHTKSNAISICKDGMLIGNGAGQMSRVMSCRIATWLAKENGHVDKLAGSVAASDAFFPFRDGPDLLIAAGVTAIIQPGGSKRDADTIAACDERNVAMIFTGTRHFKH